MTRTCRAACAALFLAVSSAAQPPIAQQIAASITPNDLKADISFLASDALEGRGTPSKGQEIAAEFIAAQFRRAGLEPAGDDGYFQTAPFLQVSADPEGLQLTLDIAGKSIAVDRTAMSISDAAAADLKNAPIHLSPITEAAKLTPDQVRGKVLILDTLGRPVRVRTSALARLEPALVIVLTANPPAAGGAGAASLRIAAAPAIPGLLVWDKAVREALADVKPGPAEATVTAHIAAPKTQDVKLRNIVGVLRGSDEALKDTYVLLTAHYDHVGVRGTGDGDRIYNGANDDASGTAALMEIARALGALPSRPKRTMVFIALFGEELGLVGSRYYAQHPIFPLARTVADLNLEQVGRTDDNTGPRVGVLNATGFDFTDLTRTLAAAGEDFGIKLVKDEANSDNFFARSDNQAFADAGIPSHSLSVGYIFPDYHQPGDHWEKIDYDNLAKVARTVALGLYRVADNAEAPRWNAENPHTERYRKAR